jgi:TonB family protein
MLRKYCFALALTSIFLPSLSIAQKIVTILVVDQETGLPVDKVMIRGQSTPSEKNGIVRLMIKPGDTLVVFAPEYPVKQVIVGEEAEMTVAVSKVADDASVFSVVDETAQFPGGMASYYQYVKANLKYPEDVARDRVEGKVFVEFVILQDGTIDQHSVRVLAGPDPRLNEEAMRVARGSPAWVPGKKNGQAVRQRMVLPYAFSLGKKKKT